MRTHFSADKSSSESSDDEKREKTPFERGEDLHREKMQRDGESWGEKKEQARSPMQVLASSLNKRDDDSSFDGDYPPLQQRRSNDPNAAYKWMKSQGLGSKKQRQRAVKKQQREIDAQQSAMFVGNMSEKWEAAASAGKPAQRQSLQEKALHDEQNHDALRANADALSSKLKSRLPAANSRQQTHVDDMTPAEAQAHKQRLQECRDAVQAQRQADQAEQEAHQAQQVHLQEYNDGHDNAMASENEDENCDSDSSGGSQRRHEAMTELQI